MRGTWTLTRPADSASGKYTASTSLETWTLFASPEERAREVYSRAVSDLTAGACTDVPKHVYVLVIAVHARSPKMTHRVPDEISDSTSWVFVVEVVDVDRLIICHGGMSASAFRALRQMTGQRVLRLASLERTQLYVRADMEKESSIPSTPAAYISPQSSLSASFGMGEASAAAAATSDMSPLSDYENIRPVVIRNATAHVTAHMPLGAILKRRFEQMKSVASYVRMNNGTSPHETAARGDTPERMYEVTTIATIIEHGRPDAILVHAADVVAHWMIRLLVLPQADGFVRSWFIEQEARLVLLHLRLACTDESDAKEFASLLGPCAKHHDISYIGGMDYSMSRIGTLRAGISMANTQVGDHGKLVVQARHIANFLLPKYVAATVEAEGLQATGDVQMIAPSSDSLVFEDTCDALYTQDSGAGDMFTSADSSLPAIVLSIIEERQRDHESVQKDKYMPRKDVDQRTLPNIMGPDAEAVWKTIMPLCTYRQYAKLRDTGHLKHGEIFSLSWFLRDMNYSADAVNGFFKHYMTTGNGRMTDREFMSQHRNIGRRTEKADDWEDGVRKRPFTQGCAKQVSGDNLVSDIAPTDPTMCIGCPFKRLDDAHLRTALTNAGGVEVGDIEDIVSSRNGSGARVGCAAHFVARFGGTPTPGWTPGGQRIFANRAIEAILPYL